MARPCHAQTGRACPLCRYFRHKRIVDLDPEIPNGALDFCMAETLAEDPGRTQPRAAYPRRCSSIREWSPWPEFGSDPGKPRELGWCIPAEILAYA